MAASRTMNRTMAEELAGFAARARFEELSEHALAELKVRVLDALGCALGALGVEPVAAIRKQIADFGG